MNKTQNITSKLWAMANKLRGTMDASEYKNYILPFMFYRYLSERQDEYLKKNDLEDFFELDIIKDSKEIEEYIIDIVQSLGYAINPEYTWKNLVSKIKNHKLIASDFHNLFESFENNVKLNDKSSEDFSNVFADVNLGDTRLGSGINERTKALYDIVEMIDEFNFKNENGQDILGDVYQYLIGEFAANAGKKGGEFYTPYEVSKVLAKIVTNGVEDEGKQFRVYDPAMGSGSLLLTVQNELKFGKKQGSVEFYGQELNTTTYNLARMNLMMHGVHYLNMTLKRGDTLDKDWPSILKNGIETPALFDAVVANPPYSQKWSADLDKDPRFKAGIAPKSRADYAFIQHSLYHLDSSGTMAIVLPHGVLFRGGSEAKIREQLIRENRLDAIIGLPENLFYGTSIPTCILVFKGLNAKKDKDILFIDASRNFDKVKTKNVLLDNHIDDIIQTYIARTDKEKYSYLASFEEIEENEFNLNIPRYVDTFEEEEVVSLKDSVNKLIETDIKIKKTTENLVDTLNKMSSDNVEINDELTILLKWLEQNK